MHLPWKENPWNSPDNLEQCQFKLTGFVRQLKAEGSRTEYDIGIQDQFNRGIVEEVGPTGDHTGLTHYLSHQPVIRREKNRTKFRVVWEQRLPSLKWLSVLSEFRAMVKIWFQHQLACDIFRGNQANIHPIRDVLHSFAEHRVAHEFEK